MRRLFIVTFISASIAGRGPPLVWGGDEATKGRLLDIIVDDVIRDAIVSSKYKGCTFKEVGEGLATVDQIAAEKIHA